MFLARFQAYLGCCDSPYVPKSLNGESLWDQKRVKSGPKMEFSGRALGPTEVLKGMCLDHFVGVLGCLDTLYVPKTFGRPKNA